MISARGMAPTSATDPLVPWDFTRREPGPSDVLIHIQFCGGCHSDLHTVRGEWGTVPYPLVPGHEIVGRVAAVGSHVTRFREGDLVGVGCMVDSCRDCDPCRRGLEQYCENGNTGTYAGIEAQTGRPTQGGYSTSIVVDQDFVLRIPDGLDPARTAPLLCAGITTYSPLRRWGAGPGKKVGIAGLGGLGHMGVKFSRALGAHTVLFTTSPSKVEDGKRLGAHEVVVTREPEAMIEHRGSFDLVLDTVSAQHDINAYLQLLKLDGSLVLVGAPEQPLPVAAFNLLLPRRHFSGSAIGGIRETQEMLEFCAAHKLSCDIELISIQDINQAYERLLKQDVRYRFVIDMATLT